MLIIAAAMLGALLLVADERRATGPGAGELQHDLQDAAGRLISFSFRVLNREVLGFTFQDGNSSVPAGRDHEEK
jgi:hypothetical protein